MINTLEHLENTFTDLTPQLSGIYTGKTLNEIKSMFHLAYWMHNDKKTNDNDIDSYIFKIVPFELTPILINDLHILIDKAKTL